MTKLRANLVSEYLWMALLLTGFGLWLWPFEFTTAVRGAEEPTPEFYHDFRGRPLPPELTPYQVKDDKLLQFEPQGLRITLPKTYVHPYGGVGVKTSTIIRGDFEVTATVEVLDLEPPRGGVGAGVGLSVDTAKQEEQLRRVVGPKGKHSLLWTGYLPTLDKKNPDWKHGSVSCTVDVLRMRLKRTGATLHFLWAPGAVGDDFVEVHEKDFGADDIEHVRLFALNGRQPCNVDVRLIDLRIRSAGQADTPLPTAPKTETKGWWAAGLIGALGVILSFAAAAWLLARKRRRADKTPEPPATKDEQTRLPPDGDGEMATAPISIQCSACGKNLRARAELVGKKVRCPHCGKPVLVPGAKVDEP